MTKKTTQKCSEGNTKTSDRYRDWCWTSFEVSPPKYDEDDMKYLAYEQETCPKTSKKHWQGFVYFRNAKTLRACKNALGKKLHLEPKRGSHDENMKYCSKEGNLTTFGVPPQQGNRRDLDDLKGAILSGKKKVDDIVCENPMLYHQYGRTLTKLEDLAMRKCYRKEMTKATWFWGETNVGKSHKAFEGFTPETHYVFPNDNGWWDGYTQQETVILNDFRGEMPYNQLLQMIDKWPYSVKRRNREPMPFTSKHVIITSSLPPEKIYHNRDDEDAIEQLLRRVNVVRLRKSH